MASPDRDDAPRGSAHPPQGAAKASDPPETNDSRSRVLVVEDNPVNQRVAVLMLGKLGYRADVARNGLEAIEALADHAYAAVLMDCQMPKMNGYEATERIREMEGGARRIPIIAMTAKAMSGDEAKALEAGMDDYVPKPVDQRDLAETLARWIPEPAAPISNESPSAAPAGGAPPVLDAEMFASLQRLDRAAGSDELVGGFLQHAAGSLEKLRGSVARADAADIETVAHNLRGSVGTLGARRMAEMCSELQKLASNSDYEAASALLGRIAQEFDLVCIAMGQNHPRSPAAGTR